MFCVSIYLETRTVMFWARQTGTTPLRLSGRRVISIPLECRPGLWAYVTILESDGTV
jgi:hypothetical protein